MTDVVGDSVYVLMRGPGQMMAAGLTVKLGV